MHGSRRIQRRGELEEAVVQQCYFKEILRQRPSLYVVVVCFRYAAHEVHWVRKAHVILKNLQDVSFGAEDLGFRKAIIGDAHEVTNVRRQDLLVL